MTDRKAQKRRLERAGYVFRSGWLPLSNPVVRQFGQQVEMHADDVEKVLNEEGGKVMTPAQRKLLERLSNGPKLRVQIEGSGRSRTPNDVLRAGWARLGDDPSVKDPWGYPALSYFLTEVGREQLATYGGKDGHSL